VKKDKKYLNALNTTIGTSTEALHRVHSAFGNNWKRAYTSDFFKFINKEKLPDKLALQRLRHKKKNLDVDRAFQELEKYSIDIITILDKDYPALLRQIADPPFMLYVRGDRDLMNDNCFAVVGTRKVTDYGKAVVSHIVGDVGRAGFTVISGLAAGIDSLAHRAVLDIGLKTISVFGTGLDDRSIFPPRNAGLAKEIIETGGLLISEYAPGTHGSKLTFPMRNRIISGLSKGVLIVEAGQASGSVITANCALDQNRDVYAVPGNIFSQGAAGTNYLIKNGAKLVMKAKDILEEYDLDVNNRNSTIKPDNEVEEKIINALIAKPCSVDDIARETQMDLGEILSSLTVMELDKKVREVGNKKYVLYS